jgi:hypothetical protein
MKVSKTEFFTLVKFYNKNDKIVFDCANSRLSCYQCPFEHYYHKCEEEAYKEYQRQELERKLKLW